MAILEVLNVGQGDSMILRPDDSCQFHSTIFLIDLGPGKYDITQQLRDEDKVHIFLTHHDADHLNGLRFFINKMHQVKEITVPFYQNEITLIAAAILNLKGMNTSKDCGEFIKGLNEIVNNQFFLNHIFSERENCPRLSFAYDEKCFCNHIMCLNPPMMMQTYDWLVDESAEHLILQLIYEVFDQRFASNLEAYIQAKRSNKNVVDAPELNDFLLWEQDINSDDEVNRIKANYVINFIVQNVTLFRNFNNKPTRGNLRAIYNNFVKCTHDACVVLKVMYKDKMFLLTGDASKRVFNRLIQEGKDISAAYLKMPHHGSKYNMNKKILNQINPEVAIISHDNGHFGASKDTHPNKEILTMLQNKGVEILITNDVIKDGAIWMRKEKHKNSFLVKIF